MYISPEFIKDLTERVDLAELIGAHVKLERKGANWLGLCPFHREKTPSFTVNPAKGFYHCFGCGAHGNAIGFMQQHEGADFITAVERLAAIQGMTVVHQGGKGGAAAAGQRQQVSQLLAAAMHYFQQQLHGNRPAQEYLKSRGLSGETLARYKIGYAPKQWEGIKKALNAQDELLLTAGLQRKKEQKTYDYFRERIIFPIIDGGERVCGFGGRALSDAQTPKYLNSADSRYFSKRRLLFGMPQALAAARQNKRLIICEGYMDAVMLSQGGFSEAVATMGTAATAEQMQKAAQLAPNIYFAYDADTAGQKGAFRALRGVLPALADGISVFFMRLPPGHDPDSYLTQHGAAAFTRLIDDAAPLGEYLITALYEQTDTAGAEGQAVSVMKTGGELLQLLHRERAPLWRQLLAKKLQERTGIAASALKKPPAARRPPRSPAASGRGFLPRSLLFNLLCCLTLKPALAESLPSNLPLPEASAEEAEIIHDILHRLRWQMDDDETPAAVNVPEILKQRGHSSLVDQLRRSIRNRYAQAADVQAELNIIVKKLEDKHQHLIKKREILDKLKAQTQQTD